MFIILDVIKKSDILAHIYNFNVVKKSDILILIYNFKYSQKVRYPYSYLQF